MRKLLLLTTLLATPAFAADLQPRLKPVPLSSSPTCQWCGVYLGVNVGYGGADFIANFNDSDPFADVKSLSAKHSTKSLLGGAHIGYNYQFGMIVFGAETDISLTGLSQTSDGVETKLPWLGTTRLRAGFAINEYLLLYATGGAAYGHVKVGNADFIATTPTVGWTAGGGVEYKLAHNIGLGVEYLHVDLDGPSLTVGTQTIGSRVDVDIVRAKLNYYF